MAKTPHQALLSKYIKTLDWAVKEAVDLRADDFARFKNSFEGDVARAAEAFEKQGPLYADPYVVGAVREYWIKCDQLNRKDPANAIEPQEFVFHWLARERSDLSSVVARFPYWPVGLTSDGRWI